MNMNFYAGTKLITGKDCIESNSYLFKRFGKKCLIVTGKSSAVKCGALSDVTDSLEKEGIAHEVYNGICQNPTAASCIEAGKQARNSGADFIIGIGGGSPLDASKAVAAAASNPDMNEADLYAMNIKNKPLPLIAVGTTAGTGSEVTPVSVLTNCQGMKKSIKSELLYPAISFGDPKYTVSLSEKFTRSTAIDAAAHCIESYFNRTANTMSEVFAVSGLKILSEVFDKINSCGVGSLTYDDREKLYNASILGGYAISVTGTAMPHSLGYFLTENYGIPHGTACGAYLSKFIDINLDEVPEKADKLFNELRTDADSFKEMIKRVSPEISVKLTDEDIAELAPRWDNTPSLKKNFGNIDGEYISDMLRELFS
ncbi:MAG: iron-containing alcohol dehydrogenase [Clostridia bacterium]|nr:iron-containing alcohol dehydrogenase [Clostridia bacterium]